MTYDGANDGAGAGHMTYVLSNGNVVTVADSVGGMVVVVAEPEPLPAYEPPSSSSSVAVPAMIAEPQGDPPERAEEPDVRQSVPEDIIDNNNSHNTGPAETGGIEINAATLETDGGNPDGGGSEVSFGSDMADSGGYIAPTIHHPDQHTASLTINSQTPNMGI
ncbi:hypothetical protein HK102_003648, partial [Quaeritorhiza haematococci]